MNIVVVGSCIDSSNLAKELNRRLHDSIVARIDLLKNIKQLVLQDMNVTTTENIGTYVGDVEAYDLSKASTEQRQQIATAIESITKNVAGLNKRPGGAHIVSTFDALTNSLPTGTYSFIKVYSGAVNDARLLGMINDNAFLTNTIFVVLKSPQNPLIPITVSSTLLERVKKDAFAFVECDKISEVFKTDVFQLLFELSDEKKESEKSVEIKAAVEEQPVIVPGQGLLNHIMLDQAFNNMMAQAA